MNLNPYRSILCLDGDLPNASFFNKGLPIIAADGAANTLMRIGIKPTIVVGDFDGISAENKALLPLHYDYDQNYSDYQKTLKYIKEQDLAPSIVVGVNGGYLDHILNNVNIFIGTDHLLYAPPIYGKALQSGDQIFTLPLGTKISLFGMPSASISSKGLKWELNQYQMDYPGPNSCFNLTVKNEIALQVHEGTCLVLIYE